MFIHHVLVSRLFLFSLIFSYHKFTLNFIVSCCNGFNYDFVSMEFNLKSTINYMLEIDMASKAFEGGVKKERK